MKSYKNIILSIDKKGIARIILAEPSTYNALSFKTILSLIEIFKKLNLDNKVKVIIIEGQGKGFCAGHDLKEIRGLKGKSEYQRLFNKLTYFFELKISSDEKFYQLKSFLVRYISTVPEVFRKII